MAFDPATALLDIGGKLLDRFLPDPVKRDEAKAELFKAQQSGELARMANETEVFKAGLADLASAREREVKIASSEAAPLINKIITPVLAASVILLSFILFAVLIFAEASAGNKDILIYILGVLSAIDTQIIAYYFGSSQGSAKAGLLFRDLIKKQSEGNGS